MPLGFSSPLSPVFSGISGRFVFVRSGVVLPSLLVLLYIQNLDLWRREVTAEGILNLYQK